MSYSKIKTILEKKENIDLSQYEVLNNIDEQIRLNLLINEKLIELKKALFLQKLTNEAIIYEVETNNNYFFLNEETFKKYRLENKNFTSGYNFKRYDIGKIRLKTLEV